MHDLSVALRKRGTCSALSSALITIVAAMSIAALPAFSAASFINAKYGAAWALIQANTDKEGLPNQISIGMFRICYSSPGVSCLAFGWGLSVSHYSFQGAEKWSGILPPLWATKAWPLLAAMAFFVTFFGAFVHCMSNAPTSVLFSGIITVTIDLGYLGYTAYLFFDMKTKISSSTDYVPASVLVSAVMIGISAGLVLLVGFLTLFADRHGDSLEIKTVASEGNKDGANDTEKSGGDTERQAADKYATSDTSVGPEVNPYGETEDAEAFERCEDQAWLREATFSDDELTLQEYETAQWQIGRIYMLDGGIEVIDEKQRAQPRKQRTNDAPPAPHEGIT